MASLFEMLMGGGQPQAQMPGMASQQQNPLQRLLDPSFALPMAAGMMGDQGNAANFGQGFQNAAPFMMMQRQKQEEMAQRNQTVDYLRKNNPELAAMVDAGMPVTEAWQTLTQQKFQKPQQDEYQTRAAVAAQQGLTGADAQEFILTGQLPSGKFGSAETGLTPIWGTDAQGKYILMQPTKSGKMVQSQMPDGVSPLSPYDTNYQKSSGTKAGGGHGEALATYDSMSSKMPGLETVISQLDGLAEKATYTMGGQALDAGMRQLGMEPRESAVARQQYISMVDNQILPLLRDTFGAQFTQKEGETLRATLGDPDRAPKEKQAILKAFIEQKRRDIEALARQTGQQAPSMPGGGNRTSSGVQWSIEP